MSIFWYTKKWKLFKNHAYKKLILPLFLKWSIFFDTQENENFLEIIPTKKIILPPLPVLLLLLFKC